MDAFHSTSGLDRHTPEIGTSKAFPFKYGCGDVGPGLGELEEKGFAGQKKTISPLV